MNTKHIISKIKIDQFVDGKLYFALAYDSVDQQYYIDHVCMNKSFFDNNGKYCYCLDIPIYSIGSDSLKKIKKRFFAVPENILEYNFRNYAKLLQLKQKLNHEVEM